MYGYSCRSLILNRSETDKNLLISQVLSTLHLQAEGTVADPTNYIYS